MHQQKRPQEQTTPEEKGASELLRLTDDKARLQQAELVASNELANAADVGDAAGDVVDLTCGLLALFQVRDETESGQKIFTGTQLVQVGDFLRGERARGVVERPRFDAVDHV